jgi:hypothetical protein
MEPRVKSGQFDSHDPEEAVEAIEQTEGPVARAIESKTAQIPSDVFLWASLGSMALSLALQLSGNKKTKHLSNFIGQWAPTLLVLGLYNKIVKVAGHDRA